MPCISCKNKKLKKIVKIGKQPLSGVFYNSPKFTLKKYSLDLYECDKCNLVQLKKTAKKSKMFGKTYEYRTSLSNLMRNHIFQKVRFLKKHKLVNTNSSIIDIGSNDGTFLNCFQKSNNLIGVDPTAKKFEKFYKRNVHICSNFFSEEAIKNFLKKKEIQVNKFDVITSFAMFYDVENPNKFCKDIFNLLNENGIWMLELSYMPLMLKNLTYDQICHEHISYYSLTTFKKIIEKNNIKLVDINFNEINGGSIEIICAKKNSKHIPKNKRIEKVLLDEKKINNVSFKRFNKRINNVKKDVRNFFSKNSDKLIIGYGASTKGNVVLNHCKLRKSNLKYVCDGSSKKEGMYTPGTNLKIISKKKMRELKPSHLFILIWSFRKEVIKQELSYLKNGGQLVFHLPRFHIVNYKNYKFYLKNDFKKLSYGF